jgi:ribonucleotide monophosphatase NagD (HAD superfamily)
MTWKPVFLAALFSFVATASSVPQVPPAARIPTQKATRDILIRLKSAVAAGDRRTVGTLTVFPLTIMKGRLGVTYVGSARVLMTTYNSAFSKRVRDAVLAQNPDSIALRNGRFVIGQGELAIGVRCESDDPRSCQTGVIAVMPYKADP